MFLSDKFGRRISDLRISVTDRCNYKCVYCRSGNNGAQFAEMPIADYLRMARVLVGLGITKVRLTGGEPLLRKGIVEMVRDLSRMQTLEGDPLDIAITTNGHLLAEMAQPLADAGLSRVTVSMDAVDRDEFARITRVPNGYDRVLAGIRAAQRAGLGPVKVNCVLLRGFNDDQITAFGKFARDEGVVVRFIEFMPLEEDRVWSPAIVAISAAARDRTRPQRDRPPLRLRRRRRRDRYYRAGIAPLLRTLQPGSPYLGRQDPHLPVLRPRTRPGGIDGEGRQRRGYGQVCPPCRRSEGRAPSHRRAGIRAGVEDDGAYRGIRQQAARASGIEAGPVASCQLLLVYPRATIEAGSTARRVG